MSPVGQHSADVLQLALGGVFALAAASKLRDPAGFRATVARYELLPRRVVTLAAYLLIATEALLALAFLTGRAVEPAIGVAAVTLAAFAAATAVNLRRGHLVPCGCFGQDEEPISARSLVRIGLLAVALGVFSALLTGAGISALTPGESAPWTLVLESASVSAFALAAASWGLAAGELRSVLHLTRGG